MHIVLLIYGWSPAIIIAARGESNTGTATLSNEVLIVIFNNQASAVRH